MVIQHSYFSSWIDQFFSYLGGCFGCCVKPTPITAVDEPTKGLKIRGRTVRRPAVSDDFWSSSAGEHDHRTLQSQRSPSLVTSNLIHSSDANDNNIDSNVFINHGLILWNQTRLQWLGNVKEQTQKIHEPKLSWNASYQSLLGTSKPFAQRIPLREMIEFLVDTWEGEGMYE